MFRDLTILLLLFITIPAIHFYLTPIYEWIINAETESIYYFTNSSKSMKAIFLWIFRFISSGFSFCQGVATKYDHLGIL